MISKEGIFLQLKDRWHYPSRSPLLCFTFQVCQCWWPTLFFTTQESTLWMGALLHTRRCLSALRTGSSAATTSRAMTPPQGCPTPFSPWSSSSVYPLSSSRPSTYQYTDTSRNTGQSSNENPLHKHSLLLNRASAEKKIYPGLFCCYYGLVRWEGSGRVILAEQGRPCLLVATIRAG